jgi:hypothetical protein
MRLGPLLVALSVVLPLWTTPAAAGTPYPVEMRCPVGGETFTFIDTMSSSRWGSRPDGKPYGSWEFPTPVPACPGNGLVMYRDFSKDDIKKLKVLLNSPEFQKVKSEATYYRIAWFMRALHDEPEATALWMINQASWQVDDQPDVKARYQREFADGVAALPKDPNSLDQIVLDGRAANAWRELGDFDRALKILASVPISTLDVPIPAEVLATPTQGGSAKTVSNYDEINAARNKRGWLTYFNALQKLVERQDRSSEPLEMIPVREAARKCNALAKSGSQVDAYCSDEIIVKQIESFKKISDAITTEKMAQH